jgi:hypothetical protein
MRLRTWACTAQNRRNLLELLEYHQDLLMPERTLGWAVLLRVLRK